VRADSLAPSAGPGLPRDSSRAASVLDTGGAQAKALGLPPLSRSSKRWSSALDYSGGDSGPTPRSSRPGYTEALIKSSRRLRERSMSPTARPVSICVPPPTPYKSNLDYYRGKTKSIYEKEPLFRDFVRNIPLSQANPYDNTNLSSLKNDFKEMLKDKYPTGSSGIPDPFTPSSGEEPFHRPMSEVLARKHRAHPPGPCILPTITVYHRNSRGY